MSVALALPSSAGLAPAEVEAWCAEVVAFVTEETDLHHVNDMRERFAPFAAAYAKATREGTAAVAAAERQIEIRVGELINQARRDGELASNGQIGNGRVGVKGSTPTRTLADIGITKHDAADFVAMADNPDIVEHIIAESSDAAPATRNKVRTAITEKRREQSNEHPAKFSRALLDRVTDVLERFDVTRIADPFAGTGLVHEIADRLGVDSVGVEIEPEWASMHPRTICADSTIITADAIGPFDCVVTSPTYGNRMADKHNANDPSDRATYKHRLGRDLSESNTGGYQWTSPEYVDLHRMVWRRMVDMLAPGGVFVINVKDHVRNGERQWVSGWHLGELVKLGLLPVDDASISSNGLGGSAGENASDRIGIEHVYVLTKGVPTP